MSVIENKDADVLATIMGMTLKYKEYTKPIALAMRFMAKNQ